MAIRVQAQAFDPGAEVNAMHAANVGVGAVVSFVGYVRDFNDGLDVAGMFLEHYPGMTEKALAKIAVEEPIRSTIIGSPMSARLPEKTETLSTTPSTGESSTYSWFLCRFCSCSRSSWS